VTLDVLNDAIAAEAPDAPFDRFGRRLIVPPEGGKPVAHTRVTTFIKAIADKGGNGLRDWHARFVAKGLVDDPALMQWVLDHDADPDDAAVKRDFNKRLERAAVDAGRDDKADQGTAIHDAISRHIAGLPVVSHPEVDGPLAEFVRLCEAHSITIHASEQIIVNARYNISGRFDLIGTVAGGPLVVLDIKTGSLDFGVPDYGPQLWLYATATTVYDAVTETHSPMHAVAQDHAYILHVPRDGSTGALHRVELAGCEEMCELAVVKRAWPSRAKKQMALVPEPTVDLASDRQSWALERVVAVVATAGADRVRREWDDHVGPGIPTPKFVAAGTATWTDEQVDAVAAYCDRVEAAREMPFGPTDPQVLADAPTPPPMPDMPVALVTPFDDGTPGDRDMLKVLSGEIKDDVLLRSQILRWSQEAQNAGVPWWPDLEHPSALQCEIARAAVRCAQRLYDYEADDDDVVRAALHTATGDDSFLKPIHKVGALLGTLTVEQAAQLADIATWAVLRFDASGSPRFVVPNNNTQKVTHT
jgi:hypothetical protein